MPTAICGPGAAPETSIQGRVPLADFNSGRAALGYRCNTELVSHFGATGGFKVLRYVDPAGHVCAYYDTTLVFPKDIFTNAGEGLGVYAMDMSDPAHPVHTATLSTPAMLSPHESLLLNAQRGLLAADMGSPGTQLGFLDVYDLKPDCRHPVLESSLPLGILGHESAWSPDGLTFWVSSAGGHTIDAVDLTNPTVPQILWLTFNYVAHGMRVSDDGNRLYIADLGGGGLAAGAPGGLTILDVSQVQSRVLNPQVTEVSHISWPEVSLPQVPIPMTIAGHKYLFEVDEYFRDLIPNGLLTYIANSQVGAARIINIDDDHHPVVVSNLRLAVNNTDARATDQRNDPGASFGAQGYAGHYCSLPREVDPGIVACSFIVSGERIFNVTDPVHPREVAYFNMPAPQNSSPAGGGGAYAMSQPAWDLQRHQVWYSDGNSGLWAFHITNGAWPDGLSSASGTRSAGVSLAPLTSGSAGRTLPNTGAVSPSRLGGLVALLLLLLVGLAAGALLRRGDGALPA